MPKKSKSADCTYITFRIRRKDEARIKKVAAEQTRGVSQQVRKYVAEGLERDGVK